MPTVQECYNDLWDKLILFAGEKIRETLKPLLFPSGTCCELLSVDQSGAPFIPGPDFVWSDFVVEYDGRTFGPFGNKIEFLTTLENGFFAGFYNLVLNQTAQIFRAHFVDPCFECEGAPDSCPSKEFVWIPVAGAARALRSRDSEFNEENNGIQ